MESTVTPSGITAVRVLIVDDEPLFVDMVEALLAGEDGIEVMARAPHGKDAVRLAAELHPDVILMDISMPVMNGIEATREICGRNGGARILILTGAAGVTEIDEARQAGAAAYLTKDQIASELVSEIRALAMR